MSRHEPVLDPRFRELVEAVEGELHPGFARLLDQLSREFEELRQELRRDGKRRDGEIAELRNALTVRVAARLEAGNDGGGAPDALPFLFPVAVAVATAWECCGGEKPRRLNSTNRATLSRWEEGESARASRSTLEKLVGEAVNRSPDVDFGGALIRNQLQHEGRLP